MGETKRHDMGSESSMDAMSGAESATRGTETPDRGGMLLWMIFTGLTAFDTQRIGRMAAQMSQEGDAGIKFGIMGALRLYLDFINMFLAILRLFGKRR